MRSSLIPRLNCRKCGFHYFNTSTVELASCWFKLRNENSSHPCMQTVLSQPNFIWFRHNELFSCAENFSLIIYLSKKKTPKTNLVGCSTLNNLFLLFGKAAFLTFKTGIRMSQQSCSVCSYLVHVEHQSQHCFSRAG